MSLRLRFALTYSVLVALIVAVLGATLYATMRSDLRAEMDRRLLVRASQVQLVLWPGTTELTWADLTSAKLDLAPLADLDAACVYVQVLDRAGQVIATSVSLRGATLPPEAHSVRVAIAGKRAFADAVVGNGQRVRILSLPITHRGDVLGILQVAQSRRTLQEVLARLRTLLLALGGAAVAASGLIGWLVARRGLRPLEAMAREAATIAVQRAFGQRLRAATRTDEVGQLARTIDGLLATVDDTLRRHREFVADTSHELRNPLLAIRTNLELMNRLPATESRAECIREVEQQVERMTRLVSDLLMLARVQAGEILADRPVRVRPLLVRAVQEVKQQARGQHVDLLQVDDLEVLGDECRLLQVLANLLDNALRHTPPGGAIRVSAAREADRLRLMVADTGSGIAPEHLPHILDRFYRGDRGRRSADGHSGLGLAIVKHLVSAHGGDVAVASTPGQGSTFTVWLPIYYRAERQPVQEPVAGSVPRAGVAQGA